MFAACRPDIPDAVPATSLDSDGATGDASRVCDVFAQDCDEGEKCLSSRPYAQPILVDGADAWCAKIVDAPAGLGEACTVDREARGADGVVFDDCGDGLLCWSLDDDSHGRCEALCAAELGKPTCAPDYTCPIDAGARALVCVPRCVLGADDCEHEGEACYLQGGQWGCYPSYEFVNELDGTTGWPCSYQFHCRDAHACLAAEDFSGCPNDFGYGGCCAKLCALEDPDADAICAAEAPDRLCRPWLDAEDAGGYANIGVCIP